jgi:UDP-galactopyranose mutase
VHAYGPHLFHTDNEAVMKFLEDHSQWIPYRHKVIARVRTPRGPEYVPFPPNLQTLRTIPKERLVEVFYRPYTELMWGRPLEEVSPKILDRVPVRETAESNYFADFYQALPKNGYTNMVWSMLNHPDIDVKLGFKAYHNSFDYSVYDKVYNCASVDQFFDYSLGELPYRSIKFKTEKIYDTWRALPAATVNYTEGIDRTRSTEWKQLPNSYHPHDVTLVTTEYPCSHKENNHERYYPVRTPESEKLYHDYLAMAAEKHPNMQFVGRCGSFAYIDMHQAINMGLQTAKRFIMERM